jgi:hypothetical protein
MKDNNGYSKRVYGMVLVQKEVVQSLLTPRVRGVQSAKREDEAPKRTSRALSRA